MERRLGLATRTQISVCKSPFPSAGTAVSLFCAKTVQQRPLLPREVETRLPVFVTYLCRWNLKLQVIATVYPVSKADNAANY